ncbi:hypothetical protein TNCV_1743281 [Trichonephila clavipes]|nr:hypothetical protein TNCV_1743281 [Trichonephila clavipes]
MPRSITTKTKNAEDKCKNLEMHVCNTSTLSLEKTALLNKLHKLEESNLEKVDKLVKLEEKYEILQKTLKITEQRLVEKEIECASLTEKILIVNTQTESNDHPKTSMSTKEREINPSNKTKKSSLVEEILTKQVIVMRIKPLPKRKMICLDRLISLTPSFGYEVERAKQSFCLQHFWIFFRCGQLIFRMADCEVEGTIASPLSPKKGAMSPTGKERREGRNIRTERKSLGPQERQTRIG